MVGRDGGSVRTCWLERPWEGLIFDPRLHPVRVMGRVRKVRVHSWDSGGMEGASSVVILERDNGT